jgi:hypothetical protein
MSDNEMDDIWERIDLVTDEVGGDLAKIVRCRNKGGKGLEKDMVVQLLV